LGISLRRVQQLVSNGRLPATEFGGSFMILESDLQYVLERKPGRPRKKTDAERKAISQRRPRKVRAIGQKLR